MSRVALELGETSIDRAKITPTPDGGYRMQWSMRLLNGRLIKKTTKGKCTKGELRRRAHAQAEEILATGGGSTPWKGSSSMRDYIRKEVIPGIERTDDSILRPRRHLGGDGKAPRHLYRQALPKDGEQICS